MKTIRINVFETNSSSSHSVVLLDYFDYERGVNEKDACYDFDKNEITLSFNSKKATVPISRSFYASFKKAFYEYMG